VLGEGDHGEGSERDGEGDHREGGGGDGEGVHGEGVHGEGVHGEGVHGEGVHGEGVHGEGVEGNGVWVHGEGSRIHLSNLSCFSVHKDSVVHFICQLQVTRAATQQIFLIPTTITVQVFYHTPSHVHNSSCSSMPYSSRSSKSNPTCFLNI
jgi:hypothetical protein